MKITKIYTKPSFSLAQIILWALLANIMIQIMSIAVDIEDQDTSIAYEVQRVWHKLKTK